MNTKQAKVLLQRYRMGLCSPEEVAAIEQWYRSLENEGRTDLTSEELDEFGRVLKRKIFSAIREDEDEDRAVDAGGEKAVTRRIPFRYWWYAAASAALILAVSTYFFRNGHPSARMAAQSGIQDIGPGGNKAVLILANGTRLNLDSAGTGELASQGNSKIIKADSGLLEYKAGSGNPKSGTDYNTLSTPRGGEYELVLPDETKVWLNAASSIHYPVAFTGSVRKVNITGEVYFEVARSTAKPFIVTAGGQAVEVLGTHFNVNAYTDEPAITTTLLDGKVKVSVTGRTLILQPGQQSVAEDGGHLSLVQDADTAEAVAWKENLFRFNSESLADIMRKISRWYDVDVVYKDASVRALPFGGVITRFSSVSEVLGMLELTHEVHFRIEGRKIIVLK